MNMQRRLVPMVTALMLAMGTALPAQASNLQLFAQNQQPDDMPDQQGEADQGEASAMVVRVGRLENQIRQLTGQIEQLQYQNKRLEDNLRKMQGDVDFRFQDLQGRGGAPAVARPAAPQKRSETDASPGALADAAIPPPPAPTAVSPAPPAARVVRQAGDAFDPAADPAAPGAPKALGTTEPSRPLATRPARQASAISDQPQAPLDLMQRPTLSNPPDAPGIPAVIPAPSAAGRDPGPSGSVASLVPGGTREEYEADLGLFRQGQFDGAATGFQSFADKYPKDRLVPDAVYLAGESYARLGRHREAAEQFLKIATDYSKSPRAPDALLRLGMSLSALGAKEQACATYEEVTRRFPTASQDVRTAVDRELKRARCVGSG